MARAKKCAEEFNPWPPFVDVFSSVILVLLLFILVTIVNVAYYMQFNSKSNSQAATKSQTDSLQAGKDIQDMIALAKQAKPTSKSQGNDSLFTGGQSQGNAITVAQTKDKKKEQKAEGKGDEFLVTYEGKEITTQAAIKSQIADFIKQQKAKNPDAKFEISVAQPTKIIGKTIPKQISLGRALNMKNFMKRSGVKLNMMQLKMRQNRDEKYGFGYVKIKVIN